ncbi:MAG: gamma-glutamylcyclotransferase [Alkalilacustris sp.]
MRAQFFYGTLCHPPLLEAILGRLPAVQPARLPDHAVRWAQGESFPVIMPEPGAEAHGLYVPDITAEEAARLDYYEGGFGYEVHPVDVLHDGVQAPALVYMPEPGLWRPGGPWRLEDWAATWAEVVVEAARDVMAQRGRRPSAEVLARYPMLLTRAGARLRARHDPGPARLRRRPAADDVALEALADPHAGFFAVEKARLAFRRFDGAMAGPVEREAFVMGDAVTVLPYDPARDRVLVVEQFRAGAWARGDANPWGLEPVAGRIDGAETPEQAAHRETAEEAGLSLRSLRFVARYYPSPAAVTEYLYSYVALADLPDMAPGAGGLASEVEDIRTHVLPFEALMELIAAGEVQNAPLLVTALWLSRHRDALRAGA